MFIQHVIHYHQWLHSTIYINQNSQNSCDSVTIQSPSIDQALAPCIQTLPSKNTIERVENVKSLGFTVACFLVPRPHQRWRPVIDLSRLHTFLLVERFKMETPEPIKVSLIPGEWVASINLSDAYLHIPIYPTSREYLRFCHRSQVFQFTSLPFRLALVTQVFTMIVKEVKLMALYKGNQTSPIPGRLSDQSSVRKK